jgi:hypothetical protein
MESCSKTFVLGGCGLGASPNFAPRLTPPPKNNTHNSKPLQDKESKKNVDVGRIRTYAPLEAVRMMLWCEGERNCLPKGYDF